MAHLSALMLTTLGNALSEEVKDSDERAAVVARLAPLLYGDEHDELLQIAGLPPSQE